MNPLHELQRDNESLPNRLSRLRDASHRINETLDSDTVLQEVLDNARTLTGSQYGVIVLFDPDGQVRDLLSSGLSPQEAGLLRETPQGIRFFDYLRSLAQPLRVDDFASHARSVGLPGFLTPHEVSSFLEAPFLGAPVRHQGEAVGNIYLVKREAGPEFRPEDEETLAMFASQAALVIANARRHREERRVRTDLETLVDAAPVGVVVLDGRTGLVRSINREARRIVRPLHPSGGTAEELLEVATITRADGTEFSLRELAPTRALGAGETVRAKEVVLSAANGESVNALMNTASIQSEDDGLDSVVVTLQDMTPLRETERLRADFLAMVSHELRAPLAAIRGSATTLLEDASDLDLAEMAQFHRIIRDQSSHMRSLIGDLLDVARIEAGALSVDPEPSNLASLVDQARSSFLSGAGRNNLNNTLRIDLPSSLPPVMADRRRIIQVLGNLLSNAARHSPPDAEIRVAGQVEGLHVAVSVSDRGPGIAADRVADLFRKFSRGYDEGSDGDLERAGLGLAICRGIVQAHGGRIWVENDGPGLGARFIFTVPAAGETPTPASRRTFRPPVGSDQTRILVVDDDPQALRYVRHVVSRAGYQAIVTGDPQEVPALVAKAEPHLVLLDLMLPDHDGIELMQELHRTARVPVIFLSIYGQDEIIARAFDLGAADYVVKPFSPTELTARIRAALRRPTLPKPPEPDDPAPHEAANRVE